MAIKDIKLKVKKHWYFWPVFLYLKANVLMGKVSSESAADFMAKKCITVSAEK